jgi:hypothetical protein
MQYFMNNDPAETSAFSGALYTSILDGDKLAI